MAPVVPGRAKTEWDFARAEIYLFAMDGYLTCAEHRETVSAPAVLPGGLCLRQVVRQGGERCGLCRYCVCDC